MSMESFTSVRNYQEITQSEDQNTMITDYIKKHPLTMVIKDQRWNNIPLPVREMIELIIDALIGQDIHTWERKSLINERFFKM